jgi:hypothetical protein
MGAPCWAGLAKKFGLSMLQLLREHDARAPPPAPSVGICAPSQVSSPGAGNTAPAQASGAKRNGVATILAVVVTMLDALLLAQNLHRWPRCAGLWSISGGRLGSCPIARRAVFLQTLKLKNCASDQL